MPSEAQTSDFTAPGQRRNDCISDADRKQIEKIMERHQAVIAPVPVDSTAQPASYPFFPQGGNLWRDLFVNNFVDLDSSTNILDWGCSRYTYNGHHGHDIDLRSFGEQIVGVPVFAALDGTVVDSNDGEFDMQTTATNAPANYVILHHGDTHYTWYWHLKNGSVAVAPDQFVRAGTQLGLTGSSGSSTYPHLHFESRHGGTWYEPSAGPCRPGLSYWINQTPIRRDTHLRDFNITDINFAEYPGLPFDMPRTGTFVQGIRRVSFWASIANWPSNSAWRVRFLKPDNTVWIDSSGNFGNAFIRWWWARWQYNVNLNVTGTWHVELLLNEQSLVRAPFTVVTSASQITNRPPHALSAFFDPLQPGTNDVIFCRVNTSLTLDDPDYDLVRYRYRWTVNGSVLRDVVTAAHSDAIPPVNVPSCAIVTCTVTPSDGVSTGSVHTVETTVCPAPKLRIAYAQSGLVTLSWSPNTPEFSLESSESLLPGTWIAAPSESTNPVAVPSTRPRRFYRLSRPEASTALRPVATPRQP